MITSKGSEKNNENVEFPLQIGHFLFTDEESIVL